MREGSASPLGTTEPIPIKLSDGSTIRVCGRVDRIDRIGQGAMDTYAIWDYKSGMPGTTTRLIPSGRGE